MRIVAPGLQGFVAVAGVVLKADAKVHDVLEHVHGWVRDHVPWRRRRQPDGPRLP
jgi:hypothetical protein